MRDFTRPAHIYSRPDDGGAQSRILNSEFLILNWST